MKESEAMDAVVLGRFGVDLPVRRGLRWLGIGGALARGAALAMLSGCSRPPSSGDEVGDGTADDDHLDTDGVPDAGDGSTGGEVPEFPDVVAEWILTRYVADAGTAPDPGLPEPPCFGEMCFERFFCGRIGPGDDVTVVVLESSGERLLARWYSPGDPSFSQLETGRVESEGGTWSVLRPTPGFEVFPESGITWGGRASRFIVAQSGLGESSPSIALSAMARTVGGVVETSYRFADVVTFANDEEEWQARLWVGDDRVWYGGIGRTFFSVDLTTGVPSELNLHLTSFPHEGSPNARLPAFRELLDGRLVLLRVDETGVCGMDQPCSKAWTLLVMDPTTGEATEVQSMGLPADRPDELRVDVDGQLVLAGLAGEPPDPLTSPDYLYVIPVDGGPLELLPGGASASEVVIDEAREVMVYGAPDGRVFVYDADTGGAQEWFDLSPGSDEGLAFVRSGSASKPFYTFALVGGRLFVTYPNTAPDPCIYVADLP